MDMTIDKLLFESIDDIAFYKPGTDEILALFDQPKTYNLSNTVDLTEQTGKNGVVLAVLEKNKKTTLTFSNGYVLMSALSAQLGSEVEEMTEDMTTTFYEFIEVKESNLDDEEQTYNINYTYEAVGVTGNEIPCIKAVNKDGSPGKAVKDAVIEATTKTIKLPKEQFDPSDPAKNKVFVAYQRKVKSGQKIVNSADGKSKNVRVVANLTATDVCDSNIKYHVLFDMFNGKVDGNNNLDFQDDGITPEITVNAVLNPCSINKDLWGMYVITED